jgi:hypothetical protein
MGALSVYLDASVVISLFLPDLNADRAGAFLRTRPVDLIVSDWCAAELASVVSKRVRMRLLVEQEARKALANFDQWAAANIARAGCLPADIRAADTFLRRLDLNLRTPEAIHIAIARRLGAELATFDVRMAESAEALGVAAVAV